MSDTDVTSNTDPVSSRTITWHDPLASAARGAQLSGLEYFHAMMRGEIPAAPIAETLNFTLVEATPGRAVFSCMPDESMYNPIGTVHGGVACTLLDSAAGCAVHTTLPRGQGYTSLEIKVSYLRPILATTGPLTVTGTVTKPGSRVAFADATIMDAEGKLLATASSTLLVFPI